MNAKQFDDLARSLARGTTRRQVLKGFAAGLSASVLATLGRSIPAGAPTAAFAQANGSKGFLPIVVRDGIDMCPVASTCDNKLLCSDMGADCRCLKSAEGEIRCGEVPSCGAQTCTTSADCANLGPDYFCDSPGSGCCNEGVQLCIAPCPAPLTECPADRLCGNACCPAGYTCENGTCVNPLAEPTLVGTWTGTLTYLQETVGIRFVITDDSGQLSGRMLMLDPISNQYLETGTITGQRTDFSVAFETEGGSTVVGDLAQDGLAGSYRFNGYNGEDPLFADLVLQRTE